MKYTRFLAKLREFTVEVENIEFLNESHEKENYLSNSSDVTNVPDPFIKLLEFVIPLLQKKIINQSDDKDKLSEKNKEVIVLVDMRAPTIIIMPIDGFPHFCFILAYVKCTKKQYTQDDFDYSSLSAVVIDFTTGQILNEQEYINVSMEQKMSSTSSFSSIPETALNIAWRKCLKARHSIPSCFVEKGYLSTYLLYRYQKEKLNSTEGLFANLRLFDVDRCNPRLTSSQHIKRNFNLHNEKKDGETQQATNYHFFPRNRHISFEELPDCKIRCLEQRHDEEDMDVSFAALSLNSASER